MELFFAVLLTKHGGFDAMIKVLAPANLNPHRRTMEEFHNYWAISHGPLFSNTKALRRYVQHLTLPESRSLDPAPTFDGASMFWYDDLETTRNPDMNPVAVALREEVRKDDQQLFDREMNWPVHGKRASIVAQEHVIVDGPTTPSMVKAIWMASRLPGLMHDEFFDHWRNVHGPLAAKAPGVRRYVQNHAIVEAYAWRGMTHDGWSEIWFDDMDSMKATFASPEWKALREDGVTLFTYPMGICVARERIQKDAGWTPKDWDVKSMSEGDVRNRLAQWHYSELLKDTTAPGKIKAAADADCLAVWTNEHLVTIDSSRIDARPDGYK
jgi:uncharacterized protein (TIGR02118 family)